MTDQSERVKAAAAVLGSADVLREAVDYARHRVADAIDLKTGPLTPSYVITCIVVAVGDALLEVLDHDRIAAALAAADAVALDEERS